MKKVNKISKLQKDWIEKHRQENIKAAELASKLPNIFSYDPFPSDYKTFGKSMKLAEEKRGETRSKSSSWGKDARFQDFLSKLKKKGNAAVIDPGQKLIGLFQILTYVI